MSPGTPCPPLPMPSRARRGDESEAFADLGLAVDDTSPLPSVAGAEVFGTEAQSAVPARPVSVLAAVRQLPGRIRHGRPLRLVIRAAVAALLSLTVLSLIPASRRACARLRADHAVRTDQPLRPGTPAGPVTNADQGRGHRFVLAPLVKTRSRRPPPSHGGSDWSKYTPDQRTYSVKRSSAASFDCQGTSGTARDRRARKGSGAGRGSAVCAVACPCRGRPGAAGRTARGGPEKLRLMPASSAGPVCGQRPLFLGRGELACLGGQLRRATGVIGRLLGQDRHLRAVAGRFGRDDPVDQAGSQRGGGTDRQARGRTPAASPSLIKSFPAPPDPPEREPPYTSCSSFSSSCSAKELSCSVLRPY
jgi:hypothetical protein